MTLIVLSRRASRACSPGCRPTPPGSRRRWTRPDLSPVPCDLSPVPCALSPPPLNLTKYTAVMQHIQTFRILLYSDQCTTHDAMSGASVSEPGVLQCPKVTCTLPPCLRAACPELPRPDLLQPSRGSTRVNQCTVGNSAVLTRHIAFQRASDIVLLICT